MKPDVVGRTKLDQLRNAADEYEIVRRNAKIEAERRVEEIVASALAKRNSLLLECEAIRQSDDNHGLSMAAIKQAGRVSQHSTYQQLTAGLSLVASDSTQWATHVEPFAGTFRANDWVGEIVLTRFYGWTGELVLPFERDMLNPDHTATSGYYVPVPDTVTTGVPAERVAEFQSWAFGLRS